MTNTALIGAQWGDEGKGKAIDVLVNAPQSQYELVARFQGGSNAGHTIYDDGKKYVLHLVPSGIVKGIKNVIGPRVVASPRALMEEIQTLRSQGLTVTPENLFVSGDASVTLNYHRTLDAASGGEIGTTNKGIGPTYADRTERSRDIRFADLRDLDGLAAKVADNVSYYNHLLAYPGFRGKVGQVRLAETLAELAETRDFLLPFITDDVGSLFTMHDGALLFEGAQGTLLDVDYGTSPFVTSSNTTVGGVYTGTGKSVAINRVIGVMKMYTTRVGEGPFVTEFAPESEVKQTLPDKEWLKARGLTVEQWERQNFDEAETLRAAVAGDRLALSRYFRVHGGEYGATTGRPRRCGWGDAVIGRYAQQVNGITDFCMTKLDCLDRLPVIKVAVGYTIDGKPVSHFPARQLGRCKPEYIELAGWLQDTSGCRTFEDLPRNAQNYVETVAKLSRAPASIIGVGSDRKQTIVR